MNREVQSTPCSLVSMLGAALLLSAGANAQMEGPPAGMVTDAHALDFGRYALTMTFDMTFDTFKRHWGEADQPQFDAMNKKPTVFEELACTVMQIGDKKVLIGLPNATFDGTSLRFGLPMPPLPLSFSGTLTQPNRIQGTFQADGDKEYRGTFVLSRLGGNRTETGFSVTGPGDQEFQIGGPASPDTKPVSTLKTKPDLSSPAKAAASVATALQQKDINLLWACFSPSLKKDAMAYIGATEGESVATLRDWIFGEKLVPAGQEWKVNSIESITDASSVALVDFTRDGKTTPESFGFAKEENEWFLTKWRFLKFK